LRSIVVLALLAGVACGGSPAGPRPDDQPRVFFVAPGGDDSGAGTVNAPWRHFAHAVRQLRPGDTLYLRGGDYNDVLDMKNLGASATSWSNAITIAAYGQERPVIRAWPGADYLAEFDRSASYVSVSGLVFDGGGTAGGAAGAAIVLGNASHHIRLQSVEVTNAWASGILAGGSNHELLDLHVHGNGVGADSANGLYMGTDNTSVIGGRFHDNVCFGVRFFDSDPVSSADNNVVRGAQIFRNGNARCSSAGGGVVLGDVSNFADGNEIYENALGILIFGFKPTHAAKVHNNRVRNNAGIGIQIMSGASSTDVRNNAVHQNGIDIIDEGSGSVLTNNGP
jgi:hypothetical protein